MSAVPHSVNVSSSPPVLPDAAPPQSVEGNTSFTRVQRESSTRSSQRCNSNPRDSRVPSEVNKSPCDLQWLRLATQVCSLLVEAVGWAGPHPPGHSNSSPHSVPYNPHAIFCVFVLVPPSFLSPPSPSPQSPFASFSL